MLFEQVDLRKRSLLLLCVARTFRGCSDNTRLSARQLSLCSQIYQLRGFSVLPEAGYQKNSITGPYQLDKSV